VSLNDSTKVIVICGPTGVGKTGFAIELALRFNGEIVGADSMQIFRRMDIGTAKPTAEEQARIPHHMVDIVDPDNAFDAVVYAHQADRCIADLVMRSKTPFIVGGTGLYIKALMHGLTAKAPTDASVRAQLQNELKSSGPEALHRRLQQFDPQSAKRIHPHDSYRIMRALEVLEITGRSIAAHHHEHGFSRSRYQALYIGLTMPREMLYERINTRVDTMLETGFADEVRTLLGCGYGLELKPMQSLGYRHIADWVHGRLTWEEAIRTMKRDHRRYAKRQMTWFGAIPSMNWLAPGQLREAAAMISAYL